MLRSRYFIPNFIQYAHFDLNIFYTRCNSESKQLTCFPTKNEVILYGLNNLSCAIESVVFIMTIEYLYFGHSRIGLAHNCIILRITVQKI